MSAESLLGQRMLNLQTRHGELDPTIRPAAFEGGYDELVGRSVRRTVGQAQVQVRVAKLEDVIRAKETPRAKDIRALPELYRLAGKQPRAQDAPSGCDAGAGATRGPGHADSAGGSRRPPRPFPDGEDADQQRADGS